MSSPYASGDWHALVAAVKAEPQAWLPKLVAADWLDDRGLHDRAEFIRLREALSREPCEKKGWGCQPACMACQREKRMDAIRWTWTRKVRQAMYGDGRTGGCRTTFDDGFAFEVADIPFETWEAVADRACQVEPITAVRLATWPLMLDRQNDRARMRFGTRLRGQKGDGPVAWLGERELSACYRPADGWEAAMQAAWNALGWAATELYFNQHWPGVTVHLPPRRPLGGVMNEWGSTVVPIRNFTRLQDGSFEVRVVAAWSGWQDESWEERALAAVAERHGVAAGDIDTVPGPRGRNATTAPIWSVICPCQRRPSYRESLDINAPDLATDLFITQLELAVWRAADGAGVFLHHGRCRACNRVLATRPVRVEAAGRGRGLRPGLQPADRRSRR